MAKRQIWFIYDGECPICRLGAKEYYLGKDVDAELTTLNARTESAHWLVREALTRGYDLNEGMVVSDGEHFYHADEALSFMAESAKPNWLFNVFSRYLWRKKRIAKIMYPSMRAIRNILLWLQATPQLPNDLSSSIASSNVPEPVFAKVFGEDWDALPQVFKKHYAHPDMVLRQNRVSGNLTVYCAQALKLFSFVFRLFGSAPLIQQSDVPVEVEFHDRYGAFNINRRFYFRGRGQYSFDSVMFVEKEGDVVERMRFGIHWRSRFRLIDKRIIIEHKAFEWRWGRLRLRLPFELFFGKAVAQEWAIDDSHFGMFVRLEHGMFGRIYEYGGVFSYLDT